MQINEAGKLRVGPYSVTKYRATAQYHLFDKTGKIWGDPGASGESSDGVHRLSLPMGQQEMGEGDAEKTSFFQALAAAQERLFERFYEATGLTRAPAGERPPAAPA